MKKSQRVIIGGVVLVVAAVTILGFTFWPVASLEVQYYTTSISRKPNLLPTPVSSDFGIIIPKINANSPVIENVDPFNSSVYQKALTQGVAHAQGTALPGTGGNIFLFSHSSVDFFEALKYNSIFYLLSKLEKNDEIILFYKENLYRYRITDIKKVNPDEVSYMSQNTTQETLTLMTCWPPGTTAKRLLVTAVPVYE